MVCATSVKPTVSGSAYPAVDSSTRPSWGARFTPVTGTDRFGIGIISRLVQRSASTTRSASLASCSRRPFQLMEKSTWKSASPTTASASLLPATWRCSIPDVVPAAMARNRGRCASTGKTCAVWTVPASGMDREIRAIPVRFVCWIVTSRGARDGRVTHQQYQPSWRRQRTMDSSSSITFRFRKWMVTHSSSSLRILLLTPWSRRPACSGGGPYPTLRRCWTTKPSPFRCATNAVRRFSYDSASTCSPVLAATAGSASPSTMSTNWGKASLTFHQLNWKKNQFDVIHQLGFRLVQPDRVLPMPVPGRFRRNQLQRKNPQSDVQRHRPLPTGRAAGFRLGRYFFIHHIQARYHNKSESTGSTSISIS